MVRPPELSPPLSEITLFASMPAKEKSSQREQRLVKCQSKCGNWTLVWTPEKSPKRSITCGFSSYEQLAKLEQRLKNLEENSSTARQTATNDIETRLTALEDNQHTEESFVPSETQTASEPTYAEILTGMKSDEKFQKDIERNIIISGINVDREKNNCINSILKDLEVSIKTESITEVGTVNASKTQLIRVTLKDTADKWKIPKEAKKLNDLDAWKNVYINPELTPQQRQQSYELRQILLKKRTEAPELIHFIKHNRVVSHQRKDDK